MAQELIQHQKAARIVATGYDDVLQQIIRHEFLAFFFFKFYKFVSLTKNLATMHQLLNCPELSIYNCETETSDSLYLRLPQELVP